MNDETKDTMSSAPESDTFECPECYRPIAKSSAQAHAAKHWGAARGFDASRLSKEGAAKLKFVIEQQTAEEEK